MDDFTRDLYETRFELAFLQKKGEEFQAFFARLMGMRFPGDFIATRPWGKAGDRKNDGYLKSEQTLFQLYAPDELEATKTVAKIDEDFRGALPHWQAYFNVWVFVHNAKVGLGPDVLNKILALSGEHPKIEIRTWGYTEIRKEVFLLPSTDLALLLGPVPSRNEIRNVPLPDIIFVIDRIATSSTPNQESIAPVPRDKLEVNGLSDAVRRLLQVGMEQSDRVQRFFANYHEPELGDRVAQAFRGEYNRLRNLGTQPDDIFMKLQLFAGNELTASPSRQAAILTVLAYLFESCDIYERLRGDEVQ